MESDRNTLYILTLLDGAYSVYSVCSPGYTVRQGLDTHIGHSAALRFSMSAGLSARKISRIHYIKRRARQRTLQVTRRGLRDRSGQIASLVSSIRCFRKSVLQLYVSLEIGNLHLPIYSHTIDILPYLLTYLLHAAESFLRS